MKLLVIIFALFITTYCNAQKFALVDRGWERPMKFADTVTKADLKEGWYPIYANELDSLILTVDKFRTIFASGLKRANFNMTDFETATIEYEISNVQMAYGDRYDINMISNAGEKKVSMKLSNSSRPNRENQGLIKRFYNYLIRARKNNQ